MRQLDAEILSALRNAEPQGVALRDLAIRLSITESEVQKELSNLRTCGYVIETAPHSGLRLAAAPDLLHASDLSARLGPNAVIGREIQVFEQTTSTNDVVDRLARDGVPEGVVVFAESQTKGRGRLGRKWLSPSRKGLWFSVLLRPSFQPQQATRLTIAAAVALRRAIEQVTALKAGIKWPNDILILGRKVAGILTELTAELDRIKYVILGAGVDVNLEASDLPDDLKATATSLSIETGATVSRSSLAVHILHALNEEYRKIQAGGFMQTAAEWEKHCVTLGQQVRIFAGDREARGRAEALAEDGALLLRTDHGHLERVLGGDVILEKRP